MATTLTPVCLALASIIRDKAPGGEKAVKYKVTWMHAGLRMTSGPSSGMRDLQRCTSPTARRMWMHLSCAWDQPAGTHHRPPHRAPGSSTRPLARRCQPSGQSLVGVAPQRSIRQPYLTASPLQPEAKAASALLCMHQSPRRPTCKLEAQARVGGAVCRCPQLMQPQYPCSICHHSRPSTQHPCQVSALHQTSCERLSLCTKATHSLAMHQ